ncbi:hypothetical protein ILUMI_15545 [Ignelater luminosus]|uniref:Uncharacterized protein n=1 Tax=Ignelater luminosus TaxID=2038154 RepID=A0A8K0CTW7_IGNLU|nr:hypothetical protein ILUMI_15545 [Ignelater luminosus]
MLLKQYFLLGLNHYQLASGNGQTFTMDLLKTPLFVFALTTRVISSVPGCSCTTLPRGQSAGGKGLDFNSTSVPIVIGCF